jgi:hypothetical protein
MLKTNFSQQTNELQFVITVPSIISRLLGHLKRFKKLLWLMLLAGLWGSSYLFAKIGVAEIPALTFAMGRAALGASILFIVLRLRVCIPACPPTSRRRNRPARRAAQ